MQLNVNDVKQLLGDLVLRGRELELEIEQKNAQIQTLASELKKISEEKKEG